MGLAHKPDYLKCIANTSKQTYVIILGNDNLKYNFYSVLSKWVRSWLDLGSSNVGKPIWAPTGRNGMGADR